jgi:hypothetical protein
VVQTSPCIGIIFVMPLPLPSSVIGDSNPDSAQRIRDLSQISAFDFQHEFGAAFSGCLCEPFADSRFLRFDSLLQEIMGWKPAARKTQNKDLLFRDSKIFYLSCYKFALYVFWSDDLDP